MTGVQTCALPIFPLGGPDLQLMPCPVVAHTAADRQTLFIQINVLPCQSADLANPKPGVVGDLDRKERGVVLGFQKIGQALILLIAVRLSKRKFVFKVLKDSTIALAADFLNPMGEGISVGMESAFHAADAIADHFGEPEAVLAEYEKNTQPLRSYMLRQWALVAGMAAPFSEMRL